MGAGVLTEKCTKRAQGSHSAYYGPPWFAPISWRCVGVSPDVFTLLFDPSTCAWDLVLLAGSSGVVNCCRSDVRSMSTMSATSNALRGRYRRAGDVRRNRLFVVAFLVSRRRSCFSPL